MKSRKKPITSEQVGGRSAICCHLMNQAYYHGQKLKWDPAKFAFVDGTGDPEVADPRLPQPVERLSLRVTRCERNPMNPQVPTLFGVIVMAISFVATAAAQTPIAIDTRRELLVDDYLLERVEGKAALRLHRPIGARSFWYLTGLGKVIPAARTAPYSPKAGAIGCTIRRALRGCLASRFLIRSSCAMQKALTARIG